jgi:choline dehydrogenase-like flavoprotein
LYDVIIAGSGPAGTFSAHGLKGKKVLMLDGGQLPEQDIQAENFFDLWKDDNRDFNKFIGKNFESLHNVDNEYLMPKLKSPLMKFITNHREEATEIESDNFYGVTTLAKGGLSNAWGAHVYRFNDEEWKGSPVKYQELKFFYDKVAEEIGVSGTKDDLAPFIGDDEQTMKPLELSPFCRRLKKRYQSRSTSFNDKGIYIGHPRVAILTENVKNRPAYQYNNLEFFKSTEESIYTTTYTLNKIIERRELEYRGGFIVKSFKEVNDEVEVRALNLKTKETVTFRSKKFILACGTLGTSKIVLNSFGDHETKLPILDNLISYIPLLDPFLVGSALQKRSHSSQLNLVFDDKEEKYFGTFYGITGIFRSDLLTDFPFPLKSNIAALKYLLSAINVLQLWYPDKGSKSNYIQLLDNKKLKVNYSDKGDLGRVESKLVKNFIKKGYLSASFLCKYPTPGNSFHYSGTLPMKESPKKYQVSTQGKLFGTKSVFIADGSCLSPLPSKNLTFTIMANALRIAEYIGKSL